MPSRVSADRGNRCHSSCIRLELPFLSFLNIYNQIYQHPSDYQGPQGTAQNDKSLKSFISGAAPRNPLALPLETPAPPLETPWRCASKPQVRRASKPLGTNFETKIFKFRWFLGPSDQNELYHTPLLSKI